jgi:NAD(P)-dependent dehydrogenase (short-subunit alcohol dehydrogenase family)
MSSLSVNLAGKVIAVTGASGALGSVASATLRAHGAQVAQIARSAPAGQLGFAVSDLADEPAVERLMAELLERTGRLDGLINIAGGFRFERLQGGSADAWDEMFRMNLRTAVVCCKAALPHLLRSSAGRIINIGAQGALQAGAGMGPYAASKAGIARLTESLAAELKGSAVTVNAILPSALDTPANRRDMPDADFSRFVPLQAAADLMAFLASDAAASITGALVPIGARI